MGTMSSGGGMTNDGPGNGLSSPRSSIVLLVETLCIGGGAGMENQGRFGK